MLQQFLADEISPELAARYGFRPAAKDPVDPISKANGVDLAEPRRAGTAGAARAGEGEGDLARGPQAGERPPGAGHVGSMSQENRLERAGQGLQTFFREVSPNDRVGLTGSSPTGSSRSCRSRPSFRAAAGSRRP